MWPLWPVNKIPCSALIGSWSSVPLLLPVARCRQGWADCMPGDACLEGKASRWRHSGLTANPCWQVFGRAAFEECGQYFRALRFSSEDAGKHKQVG